MFWSIQSKSSALWTGNLSDIFRLIQVSVKQKPYITDWNLILIIIVELACQKNFNCKLQIWFDFVELKIFILVTQLFNLTEFVFVSIFLNPSIPSCDYTKKGIWIILSHFPKLKSLKHKLYKELESKVFR